MASFNGMSSSSFERPLLSKNDSVGSSVLTLLSGSDDVFNNWYESSVDGSIPLDDEVGSLSNNILSGKLCGVVSCSKLAPIRPVQKVSSIINPNTIGIGNSSLKHNISNDEITGCTGGMECSSSSLMSSINNGGNLHPSINTSPSSGTYISSIPSTTTLGRTGIINLKSNYNTPLDVGLISNNTTRDIYSSTLLSTSCNEQSSSSSTTCNPFISNEYGFSASLLKSLEHLNVSDELYSNSFDSKVDILNSKNGVDKLNGKSGVDLEDMKSIRSTSSIGNTSSTTYTSNNLSIDELNWNMLIKKLTKNTEENKISITRKNINDNKPHYNNLPDISSNNIPSDANLGFKRTSLCKYWQRGICANEDCNFAHGKKELRSTIGVWKTTICHHWKTGICRIGKDCRHAHGEEELQPKNIPANVLKNKLLNSAKKYDYIRRKKNTY